MENIHAQEKLQLPQSAQQHAETQLNLEFSNVIIEKKKWMHKL
jgi:hypothetical protein